jgi:glutamyl-Q tRNA(Asp) synthetase
VSYRGRFAPSPTGPLHFGSLVAAFASWLDARAHQGEWLLRIEDLDPPREVAHAAQRQLQTLARFGMHSDQAVIKQSQGHARYQHALARLAAADLSFPCSCSRTQLAACGGIHRRCLGAPDLRQHAIRLRVAEQEVCFEDRVYGRCCEQVGRDCGDFVLRRRDGLYAYQLAVVVDDAEQGISDVVRGADLLWSTPRQRLLQKALGLPHPRTLHVPLVRDADGRKLSKSEGAGSVEHADPVAILRAAWCHLGQDPAPLRRVSALRTLLAAATRHWDCSRIRSTPPAAGERNVIDAV